MIRKSGILIFIIITVLTINCYANDNISIDVVDENNITLTFDDNISEDLKNRLTDIVLNHHINGHSTNNTSTYSLLCTLFGHNTENNSVNVTEHKVDVEAPRCYMTTYNVETCTRCDYENVTVIGEMYIYCCPED